MVLSASLHLQNFTNFYNYDRKSFKYPNSFKFMLDLISNEENYFNSFLMKKIISTPPNNSTFLTLTKLFLFLKWQSFAKLLIRKYIDCSKQF